MSRLLGAAAPLLPVASLWLLARLPSARQLVPALGLLVGPLGFVLWGLALLVVVARAIGPRKAIRPRPWFLFLASAAVASTMAVRYVRSVEPSGDEIDYLLMTQSIWREGDLDLRDNFERRDYLEYMSGLAKLPGGVRDAQGRYHPAHSGGLALVLAPAYALAGRTGCAVLLALLAAGLGLLVRELALKATGDEAAALVAWAACVGPPVFDYTAFLYTEILTALGVALALRQILWAKRAAGAALGALALAALPWIHMRMALVTVTLGFFALVHLRGRSRLVFAATAALGAAVFFLYFYSSFGELSPLARYGGEPPPQLRNATPARTLVGIFIDGGWGLLPYAPIYLIGFASLAAFVRRSSVPASVRWALVCAVLGLLPPILSWRAWWGFSPPARFTIPLLPVLGIALAARLAAVPGRGLARWRLALLGIGLALAAFLLAEPRRMLMVNVRDGTARGFDALAGTVSLSRYLPFVSSRAGSVVPPWDPPPSEARVAAIWIVTLLLLLALDVLAWRHDRVDRWFSGLALPLALFIIVSVAVDRVRPAPVTAPAAAPASDDGG